MPWLLAIALFLAQDAVPPEKLTVESDRPYLIEGIEQGLTLTIQAVDAKGEVLTAFTGPVEIKGLSRKNEAGDLVALESTGLFENGQVVLTDVHYTGKSVSFQFGAVKETWTPRVIPGWLTILPALLAIGLAIAFRQVLVALFAGVWIGMWIVIGGAIDAPFAALLRVFDTVIISSVSDNAAVLVFTLALGGMVGVISRNGGTRALVDLISRWANSRRSGMVSTFVLGVVVFFDDYANCLLVGNTMRPYTDERKISREKLSFLVDSTAAPIAGLFFISTWIGVELQYMVTSGLVTEGNAYQTFLETIPYRFYNVLMLIFVIAIAFSQRDFGPMFRAEQRAIHQGKVLRDGAEPLADRELTDVHVAEGTPLYWANAVIPIVVLILSVGVGLYVSGRDAVGWESEAGFRDIFGSADSYAVLLWASFLSGLVAFILTLSTRALKLKDTVDAWVAGSKAMIMACLILVLAWSLGIVVKDHLFAGQWIASWIQPSANYMPLIIFLVSCFMAFSTGTSFGTMAIVFPLAGPMLIAVSGGDIAQVPDYLMIATLSSVMSGAVFGDHCSPISDTTIMSSMGAGADHVDHVRTQAPYALVVAGVAAAVGYIPAGFGLSPWISLGVGIAILIGILMLLGKRADKKPA